MWIVAADTGPLRYLAEIGHLELLPGLFQRVFIPAVVYDELRHASTPEPVRSAMSARPDWLRIRATEPDDDPSLSRLDRGERSAIVLALSLPADLVLMDDRRGAAAARAKGFEVGNARRS